MVLPFPFVSPKLLFVVAISPLPFLCYPVIFPNMTVKETPLPLCTFGSEKVSLYLRGSVLLAR